MKLLAKSKIKTPGKRGGKYWIDDKGNVRYDEKPHGRRPAQARTADRKKTARKKAPAKFQKQPIDPKEYGKHGIPKDAKKAYKYESHEKYTYEWRDSKNRLQRRYTGDFVEKKQREKYQKINRAISRIPEMREQIEKDINGKDVVKKYTALAVRIIDITGARVGSEEHNRQNNSKGITTLEKSDLIFHDNGTAVLNYIGKKQVKQERIIDDPVIVAALRDLKKKPGKRLFQVDKKGNITANGVNKYLKDFGLTAKDLRTLRANVEFTKFLKQKGVEKEEKKRKKIISEALKSVSSHLGNTPNVCRTNYVAPELIDYYMAGKMSLKFAISKSYDVEDYDPEDYDEFFEEEEKDFIKIWSEIIDKKIDSRREGIKRENIEKSQVAGHYRKTKTGKLTFVNPYQNKVSKKAAEQASGATYNIPIKYIERDSDQPREEFNEQALKKLGQSIAKIGLMQPIGVRKKENGKHKIIFGERRWRASKMAGLKNIPARVFDVKDKKELFALQVAENLAREEMNPIETAKAYKKLFDVGMSHEEIAEKVGVSPITVQRKISLTSLIPEIQDLIKNGDLAETKGILIGMNDLRDEYQFRVLKKISGKDVTIKELDGIVGRFRHAQDQQSLFKMENEALVTGVSQINKNKVDSVKRKMDKLLSGVVKAAQKIVDKNDYKIAPAILKEAGSLKRTKDELKLLQSYLNTIVNELESADSFFRSGGSVPEYLGKQKIKKETRKKRRNSRRKGVKKSLVYFVKSLVRGHHRTTKTGKIVRVGQYQNKKTKKVPQTETKAFKDWFGDSKIKTNDGEPVKCYHGSPKAGFNIFDRKMEGTNIGRGDIKGFYFSTSKNVAKHYGKGKSENVYEVYLKVSNPLRVEAGDGGYYHGPFIVKNKNPKFDDDASKNDYMGYPIIKDLDTVVEQAEKHGYDGVIARGLSDPHPGTNVIVFSPTQIKSATDNNGDFDPKNPNITKSLEKGGFPVGHVSVYKNGKVMKKVANTGNSIKDWKELKGAAKTRALKKVTGSAGKTKTIRTFSRKGKKVQQTERVSSRNRTTSKNKMTHKDVGEKIGGAKKDIYRAKLKNDGVLNLSDLIKMINESRNSKTPFAGKLVVKQNVWSKPEPAKMQTSGMTAGGAFLVNWLYSLIVKKPKPEQMEDYAKGLNMIASMTKNIKSVKDFESFKDAVRKNIPPQAAYYSVKPETRAKMQKERAKYEALGKRFMKHIAWNSRAYYASTREAERYENNKDWGWGNIDDNRKKIDLKGEQVTKYVEEIKDNKRLHDIAYWTAINSPNAKGWKYDDRKQNEYIRGKSKKEYDDFMQYAEKMQAKYGEKLRGLKYYANSLASIDFYAKKVVNARELKALKSRAKKYHDKLKTVKNNVPEEVIKSELFKHPRWNRNSRSDFEASTGLKDYAVTAELKRAGITDPVLFTKAAYRWRKESIPSKQSHAKMERVGNPDAGGDEKSLLKRFDLRGVDFGNYVDDESREFHVNQCNMAFADMAKALRISEKEISFNGRLAIGFGARGNGHGLATYHPDLKTINITKNKGGGSLAHEWGHFLDNIVGEKGSGQMLAMASEVKLPKAPEELQKSYKNLRNAMLTSGSSTETYSGPSNITQWKQIDAVIKEAKKNPDKAYGIIQDRFPGVNKYSRGRRARLARYIADKCGKPCKITLSEQQMAAKPSGFYIRSERCGKYWARDHEMFARAFACYVEDKLNKKGDKNTYLVHSTGKPDNMYFYPYPEGAERKRVNKAFDDLFKVLRKNKELRKSIFMDQ